MNRFYLLLPTLFCLGLGACAHSPHNGSATSPPAWMHGLARLFPKKKTPPPAAAPVDWTGTIRLVNEAEKFALVESETATPVIPGEKYLAIRDGRETGTLKITALKSPPFLIADIVSGNPGSGDRIYLPRPLLPIPPGEAQETSNSSAVTKSPAQN